ncbi:MAG: PQQ-like beta-propeller repeat protein [Rhodospirillales bacterium]|nr:PQQ-like beta-propeller repeat protein [Rhodospirillales bacterium]
MSQKLKPIISYSLLFLAAIVLTGCDNYFGQNKAPSLSGKRISILIQQRSIEPDSSAAGHKIVLPAPTPNNDWPQAGGYANHAMHHMRIGKALQERWSISVGRGTNDEERLMAQPIVAGNTLFSMDSETIVSAYNLKDGAEIWSVELTPKEEDDDHVNGGLAYENGKVFATTGFGQVVAVAAKTGKVLWRRNVGAPVRSAPTARGNRVFAIAVTNKLFALNGETGAVLWSHSGIEEAINLLGGSSPAVDSGVVVAPYSSGELFALKVENGQELWADSLAGTRRGATSSALGTIRGRPIIDRGIVFAISNSGQFAAINLRTGRRIWERPVGGIESPWIAGDYLFVISNNTDLLALGRLNGRIYWVTALPEWEDPEDREGKITWTGPILASDRLIVAGSSGEALSVSPYSGKVLGKVEMLDSVSISPIVVQDSLLFLSDDAELVAYR